MDFSSSSHQRRTSWCTTCTAATPGAPPGVRWAEDRGGLRVRPVEQRQERLGSSFGETVTGGSVEVFALEGDSQRRVVDHVNDVPSGCVCER